MTNPFKAPKIIQGGMGVSVSNWNLANTVSRLGQMGVVSGTALDTVLIRRLQLGDPDGSMRRALSHFPWPKMVQRVIDQYFIPGGKAPDKQFKLLSMPSLDLKRPVVELLMLSNFAEVFLAKEGHSGQVGINYLEKINFPTLPSLLGAMLAGVNFILMGGGIPLAIPGVLDSLANWEPVELSAPAEDNPDHQAYTQTLDPREICPEPLPALERPKFLAIIASDILAKTLVRRATGKIDGFIVEGHIAGGHNAPPRSVDKSGDKPLPYYGERDIPDMQKIRDLGLPFWMAGGWCTPERLQEALALGACGVQMGTAFAYSEDSGIVPEIKAEVRNLCIDGTPEVKTDFLASPTGYPFKLLETGNSPPVITGENARERICDLGYLRHMYHVDGASPRYRCPSEPIDQYLAKGGTMEQTEGKQCLCNGLLATAGLGQPRDHGMEAPLVTSGDDLGIVTHLVKNVAFDYSAKDVIEYMLGTEVIADESMQEAVPAKPVVA
jgi:nitronate monooxygenase